MVLVIDNYDSFVHNLARYVRELGWPTEVVRNDALSLDDVAAMAPSHIVISPGPCTPAEAGISVDLVRRFGAEIPILGVCLGHQAIGQAYGGKILRALRPMHGKAGPLRHDQRFIFAGLPNPLCVVRYHSLVVAEDGLPTCLEVTARSDEGEIMALRHREHPVTGLQFHPESVLTQCGYDILRNFFAESVVSTLQEAQA